MNTFTTPGLVATPVRFILTPDNQTVASFRMAQYVSQGDSEDTSHTNWYTVVCRGPLAVNVRDCIDKGQRVLVSGNLRIRDWESGERSGVSVEIEAEHVGHDLAYARSTYSRHLPAGAPDRA